MPRSLPRTWKRRSTPLKAASAFANGVGLDLQFHGHGHRRHGVQHVVAPGNAQVETAQVGGAVAQAEIAGEMAAADIDGLHVRLRGGAVGDGAAA